MFRVPPATVVVTQTVVDKALIILVIVILFGIWGNVPFGAIVAPHGGALPIFSLSFAAVVGSGGGTA